MSEEESKKTGVNAKNNKLKIIIPIIAVAALAIAITIGLVYSSNKSNIVAIGENKTNKENVDIIVSRENSTMKEICVEENIGKTINLKGYVYFNMNDLNICADIKDYSKNNWTFGVECNKKPDDLYNEDMAEITGTLEREGEIYYIKSSKIAKLDSFSNASTNKISRQEFIKSLTEEDKEHLKKYIWNKKELDDENYSKNFIEDRFEIIDNNIIYMYTYVNMQKWGNYNVNSYLTTIYYDIIPTYVPENWKELEYSELSSYFIMLSNVTSNSSTVKLSKATGISDSELNEAKKEMNKNIDEQISNIKKKSKEVNTSKNIKLTILSEYKEYQYDNYLLPTVNRENDFKDYSLRWGLQNGHWKGDTFIKGDSVYKIMGNKVLTISYYRKETSSNNYKEESYSEYVAIGTYFEINTQDIIFYTQHKTSDLIAMGCIPEATEENTFVTPVKKITSSDWSKIEGKDSEKFMLSIAEELDKQVYEHFRIQ